MSLGFYSGEEDMEFCSFSSGTERAVKTWQVCCFIYFIHFCAKNINKFPK